MQPEMATKNAFDLIARYGKVLEVTLKPDGEIEVLFEKGTTTTLGSGLKFGIPGTGSLLFATWLRAAEFLVSNEDVENLKAPLTLLRPGVTATMVRDVKARAAEMRAEEERRQAEEERQRIETAAKRREELRRQTDIRNTRKASGQCVLCGKPLGLFQKLAKKDRHPGCKTFKEPEPAAAGK
ncbi:MAG: hypothetical protein ACYDCO_21065 [Armatimonadota bacterium]